MMSDDREAIARLSRVYRAGAAVRVGSLTYTSQCFPALSVAGIRQFSPVSTCQGEGRGFESRRPLQVVLTRSRVPCSQDSSEHGYFPGFHDHDAVAQSFAGFLVGTGRGEPGVVRFGS